MARYPPKSGRACYRIRHSLRSRGPSAGGREGATACFLAAHPGRWGQVGSPRWGLRTSLGSRTLAFGVHPSGPTNLTCGDRRPSLALSGEGAPPAHLESQL